MASSWFAWPWATPYIWTAYARGTHWQGWPGPFTPLEVVVVAATFVLLLQRLRRSPGAPD